MIGIPFARLAALFLLIVSFQETSAAVAELRELPVGAPVVDIAFEPFTGQHIVAVLTNGMTHVAALDPEQATLGPTLLEGTGIAIIEPDGAGGIYAAFQGSQTIVHRDLRTGHTSAPFSFGEGRQVITMRVLSAEEGLLSVSSHHPNPSGFDTTLYRDGVPLTNAPLYTIVRAVAPGGTHAYSMFGAHTKLRAGTNGLEVVFNVPTGPQGYNPEAAIVDDKVVVSTGDILSLDLEPLSRVPGRPRTTHDFTSMVFADPRTNMVAFYWQPFGNNFVLYDTRAQANVADVGIWLTGPPREIFPWGTNAYGVRSGDGQEGRLYVVDMQGVPRSDLSLTLVPSAPGAANGAAISYSLTLRNHGPDAAETIVVHEALTFAAALKSASASAGFPELGANEVFWELASLGAGETATLTVNAEATGPGFAVNEASLNFNGIDPDPSNNRVTNTIPVNGAFSGAGQSYLLPAAGMAANPETGEIFLSLPSSQTLFPYSVVRWNPAQNVIEPIASYPTAPERLALSENGNHLFVVLPGSDEIEQIELSGNLSRVRFLTGLGGPVGDLDPLPGAPASILAAGCCWFTETRLFDNGVPRGNSGPAGAVVLLGNDRAVQYAADREALRELQLNEAGVSGQPYDATEVQGEIDIVGAGGRVFGENGWVIDPQTGTITNTVPAGLNPLWAFDEGADEFYILSYDTVTWKMTRYQLSTLRKLANVNVPRPSETPNALVKWGPRAYAYKTPFEVVLFEEREHQPADLALVSSIIPPPSGTAAESFTWVLTITNRGPHDATNVELTAAGSGAASSTWKPAGSTRERYPNPFVRTYPLIKAGQSETVELVVTPNRGGLFQLTARIERFGEDADYGNNSTVDLYSLPPAPGVIRRYGITANDMDFNKPSQQLYLSLAVSSSIHPSSIVSLDPETFEFSRLFSLTNPPGVMASSDVADAGFAAVEGNLKAMQFEVEPRHFRPMFPIASQPIFEFVVQPGTTNVLVVSHSGGITLFSNGVPREVTGVVGAIAIDPENREKLFHYFEGTVRRFHLGAEITEEASAQLPFTEQIPMVAVKGRLVFSNGQIVDQTTLEGAGQLPGVPANAGGAFIEADHDANRLFLYQKFSNHDELRFFTTTDFSSVGKLVLPFTDWPIRLRAFDGRAALFAAGQLILFDIPPTNRTDLAIAMSSLSSRPVGVGLPETLTVSSWNNSPWTVGPGTVEVELPPDFAVDSISSSNEFQKIGQTIRFLIPEFKHGQTYTHQIKGRFATPGIHSVNATVSSATEEIAAADNSAFVQVEVLPKLILRSADVAVMEGQAFSVPFWLDDPSGIVPSPFRGFSFRMTVTNGTATAEEALTSTNLSQLLRTNNAFAKMTFASQPLMTRADNVTNGVRTLTVLLSEPDGIELAQSNLTIRIFDDESVPLIAYRVRRTNITESAINTDGTIFLSMNRAATSEVQFDYNFRSETAIAGCDFVGEPGKIVLPPGVATATIPFMLLADSIPEGSETFIVELSNPVNAQIMVPEIRVTIGENAVAPGEIIDAFLQDGRMVVRFRTVPNQVYRLLRAPELNSSEWTPVGDAILDEGGTAELMDISPTPQARMFYRVEQKSLF